MALRSQLHIHRLVFFIRQTPLDSEKAKQFFYTTSLKMFLKTQSLEELSLAIHSLICLCQLLRVRMTFSGSWLLFFNH